MDIKELEKQRNLLDKQIRGYYEDKKNQLMKEHEKYIDKCFKQVLDDNISTIYIKVLSMHDEYRANVLMFRYEFPLGLNDCVFEFTDYGLFCSPSVWNLDYIGNWTEITKDEFNTKMDEVYNELKNRVNIL